MQQVAIPADLESEGGAEAPTKAVRVPGIDLGLLEATHETRGLFLHILERHGHAGEGNIGHVELQFNRSSRIGLGGLGRVVFATGCLLGKKPLAARQAGDVAKREALLHQHFLVSVALIAPMPNESKNFPDCPPAGEHPCQCASADHPGVGAEPSEDHDKVNDKHDDDCDWNKTLHDGLGLGLERSTGATARQFDCDQWPPRAQSESRANSVSFLAPVMGSVNRSSKQEKLYVFLELSGFAPSTG
jgi:hypothetical protein